MTSAQDQVLTDLSLDEVKKVAQLARLKLTESEIEMMAQQLSAVLQSFNKLKEVNTDGVAPLTSPTPIEQRLRDDRVEPMSDQSRVLSNAGETVGRLFKVPPAVG
jgi:aspartyl-tRNA(Asn)/glutamyl-tRNA(Gln) amidotransferase subunit C